MCPRSTCADNQYVAAGTSGAEQLQLLNGQGAALEALAQCMQLSWLCILVGPSGSGGSNTASTCKGQIFGPEAARCSKLFLSLRSTFERLFLGILKAKQALHGWRLN